MNARAARRIRRAIAAMASSTVLLGGVAASADDGTSAPVQVLAHADLPGVEPGWLATHFDRVRLHKKSGLAYTARVDRTDRDLELSLHGPAMGSVKRLGVAFEVRF